MSIVRCRNCGTETHVTPIKTVTFDDLGVLPEYVRELLKGTSACPGILHLNARLMRDVMGSINLAFVRGVLVGKEEERKRARRRKQGKRDA